MCWWLSRWWQAYTIKWIGVIFMWKIHAFQIGFLKDFYSTRFLLVQIYDLDYNAEELDNWAWNRKSPKLICGFSGHFFSLTSDFVRFCSRFHSCWIWSTTKVNTRKWELIGGKPAIFSAFNECMDLLELNSNGLHMILSVSFECIVGSNWVCGHLAGIRHFLKGHIFCEL